MFLEEVAHYLQAQGLGTLGVDLYMHRLQDVGVPAFATCLFQRPGRSGIKTHDAAGVAYEQPDLGVLVRGGANQYATVMQHAQDIHEALAMVANVYLDGVWYVAIDPVSPPQDQGVDSHLRPLILARYGVTKSPS
jgi:hypothetical protein